MLLKKDMKFIEVIKHMQINIKKDDEKIILNVDGIDKPFTFETIDELIEVFVSLNKDDFTLNIEDESLNN